MTRAQVMAPAIALARDGFILTRPDAEIIAFGVAHIVDDPDAAKIFLRPDGSPLQAGDRLVQSDLAATLAAIADHGPDAFYRGAIAAKIDAAMRAHGGVMRAERPCRLPDGRERAAELRLSRLHVPVRAAAFVGRRHAYAKF